MTQNRRGGGMRSVTRALEVLETIAELQSVGVSEIARRLNEPKSSIQRAVETLAKGDWITRDPAQPGWWMISVRTIELGNHGSREIDIKSVALPYMETLRRETQETIHLAVPREASIILIERLESPHPLRYVEPLGGAASIFLTAAGKSILATFEPGVREDFFETYSDQLAESGIIPDLLIQELDEVQRRGYATTNNWRDEVVATASAIPGRSRPAVAALSISVPKVRITPEDILRYGRLVKQAAHEISARISL